MQPLRIVMYSHDSVGLGHVRRNLALAHAFANQLPLTLGRPVTGLLVTGTAVAPGFSTPEGWDWVLLPGVDKGPYGYQPRNLDLDMADLVKLRTAALQGVIAGFRPDLIVVDRHATGIHRELEDVLRRARETTPVRTVLGLREVLDAPEPASAEWKALGGPSVIQELFDAIWVYGDPSVHDPLTAGEIPFSLRRLIHYTGYLAAGRPSGSGTSRMRAPYCLTTMGGGSDGMALAEIAACIRLPDGVAHLIVTGPQMPAARRREIRRRAAEGTKVVATIDDVVAHMRQAAAVISMGGYNSICEIMSTDVPALIVPRVQYRAEQRIRACSLADAGYLDYHDIETLTPAVLENWLSSRIGTRVDRRGLDLGGLMHVPELAAALIPLVPPAVSQDLAAGRTARAAHVGI
jgi:predicted glycosyltransferase